jgi:hypothetical protein
LVVTLPVAARNNITFIINNGIDKHRTKAINHTQSNKNESYVIMQDSPI